MNSFTFPAKSVRFWLPVVMGMYSGVFAQFPGSSKIDNILSAAAKQTGPSDLIVIKDGAVVYNRSFGESSGTISRVPVSTASRWLIAATLLTLVDDGILKLDEPVGRLLPRFTGEKAQITLRQLLSHTSGLPAYSSYLKDKNLSLAKSVDSIAIRVALAAEPGTQFIYGTLSYQVAARLAEMASGKDWESLFKEKIAGPCKMVNTDFGKQSSKNVSEDAISTTDDFSNFLTMILNRGTFQGNRVLSANSVHEMISDQTARLPSGERFYGLGVWLDRVIPNDNAPTEVSSQGSRGFTPWINFCKHLVGVYSFNTDLKNAIPLIEESKKIIDEAFKDACDDAPTGREKRDESLLTATPMKISFTLGTNSMVTLKLIDPLGNELLVLLNDSMKAGEYHIPVDASKLNPGMYFYRLDINEHSETRKVMIRK